MSKFSFFLSVVRVFVFIHKINCCVGVKNHSEEQKALVTKHLCDLIDGCLDDLQSSGCIAIRESEEDEGTGEDDAIEPLPLGHIASYYYLSHRTVRLFADELRDDASTNDLIQVFSTFFFFFVFNFIF